MSTRRSAFTLIELLVVIAIIAILAAILFPVFAQAREKARGATCLSNLKQVGLGLNMYLQDYDEYYPMLQFWTRGTNNQVVQLTWYAVIYPYIKSGEHYADGTAWGTEGLFACPSRPRVQSGNYACHQDLFTDQWVDGVKNANLPTWSEVVIDRPAEIIIVQENGMTEGPWGWGRFSAWEWDLTTTGIGFNRTTGTASNDNANKDPQYDCDGAASGSAVWAGCGMHARYRHTGSGNRVFADGHAKSLPKGRVKFLENFFVRAGAADGWYGQGWYPY